jgi:SAM-dependent methyltransferase
VNLGCGTKTHPACINIDWSIYARLGRNTVAQRIAPVALRGARLERLRSLDASVIVHDLRKGIPLSNGTADVVYHSHFLEHIDRNAVPAFFSEVRRVLKPGGVHRIVLPDLEGLAVTYLDSLRRAAPDHDAAVARLIDQMVRREANGTSRQGPLRRRLENLLLGDARRRGETHMWMWDRLNLAQALETGGFGDVQVVDWQTSRIPGWAELMLDAADGREHKPGSLYVEAVREGDTAMGGTGKAVVAAPSGASRARFDD